MSKTDWLSIVSNIYSLLNFIINLHSELTSYRERKEMGKKRHKSMSKKTKKKKQKRIKKQRRKRRKRSK
jgi:hypothetical protein